MKGTRPIDNKEIRNRGLWFLLMIVGVCIGCDRDTDTTHTGPAVLVEKRPPRVRSSEDRYAWHADFDLIFEGEPIHLRAEFKQVYPFPYFDNIKSEDWEQTRNIVTLSFEFELESIRAEPSGKILILERSHQKKAVEVTLTWVDGHETFTVEAYPPENVFEGRSDIIYFDDE